MCEYTHISMSEIGFVCVCVCLAYGGRVGFLSIDESRLCDGECRDLTI